MATACLGHDSCIVEVAQLALALALHVARFADHTGIWQMKRVATPTFDNEKERSNDARRREGQESRRGGGIESG